LELPALLVGEFAAPAPTQLGFAGGSGDRGHALRSKGGTDFLRKRGNVRKKRKVFDKEKIPMGKEKIFQNGFQI